MKQEYVLFAKGTELRYRDPEGALWDLFIAGRDDAWVWGTCKASMTDAPRNLFRLTVAELADAVGEGRLISLGCALEADAAFAAAEWRLDG